MCVSFFNQTWISMASLSEDHVKSVLVVQSTSNKMKQNVKGSQLPITTITTTPPQ